MWNRCANELRWRRCAETMETVGGHAHSGETQQQEEKRNNKTEQTGGKIPEIGQDKHFGGVKYVGAQIRDILTKLEGTTYVCD